MVVVSSSNVNRRQAISASKRTIGFALETRIAIAIAARTTNAKRQQNLVIALLKPTAFYLTAAPAVFMENVPTVLTVNIFFLDLIYVMEILWRLKPILQHCIGTRPRLYD